jgi:hypothetical protein
MTALIPRRSVTRSVRVYPVVDDKVATADELVAVLFTRWDLLAEDGAAGPRIEGDPYLWVRGVAGQLWRALDGDQIAHAIDALSSLLIDEQPTMAQRDQLRMLELLLAGAFRFSAADTASRAATVAESAATWARLVDPPAIPPLPERAFLPLRADGTAAMTTATAAPRS